MMRIKYLLIALPLTFLCACHSSSENPGDTDTTVVATIVADTAKSVKPTVDNSDEGMPEIKDVGTINEILPAGYDIVNEATGQLNEDTLTDWAMVINNNDKMDSKILLILFKNPDNTYKVSLVTTDFITVRYDNELEIVDKKLLVHSDHPWHGTNFNNYDLRFTNNNWFCYGVTSMHDYANNSWNNRIDYATGKFSVSHEVTTIDDQVHVKKVEGVLTNASPFNAKNGGAALEISYDGENYYMWDRNDLWSEDEIVKLLPESYRVVLGNWSTTEKKPTNLTLQFDGTYTYDKYYDEMNRYNYMNGIYLIRHDSIILDLDTLKIIQGKSGVHLSGRNGMIFTKDND